MAYYMADFIRIGASFVPRTAPKVLTDKKIRFMGVLRFEEEDVNVTVQVYRGSVAKIVSTFGLKSEGDETGMKDAMRNKKRLDAIYSDALMENKQNLRKCVGTRTLYMVIWAICLFFLSLCMIGSVYGLFVTNKSSFFIISMICSLVITIIYRCRWLIIPYGRLEGSVYGVELQKK